MTTRETFVLSGVVESLRETKEVLRFALLCTTPDIARDAMVIIQRAEAAIARAERETSSQTQEK